MNRAAQRPGGQDRGVAENHSSDANPTIRFMPRATRWIEPVLFGWPELCLATCHSRRVLEQMISAGQFPRPSRYTGRRPYWLPSVVREWAEREQP